MAAGSEQRLNDLTNALKDFVIAGRGLLQNVKNGCIEGCPQETGAKAIGSLFGLSAAAASFFTSLSVKKRSEAEQLWKNAYHHSEVRDQVEDLLQLEAKWDAFLEHLDIHLQTSDVLLSRSPQARSLAGEMALTDARSGE
ncbi:hypothetical protein AGOR_G00084040 [Albula goreensis]|uniref:Uncharacterized protein n=1 Tax=Albula goreensis TaxID=1534307 RepID=A0A8T3DLW8_9TELE|nr:hypothetical protein AGOR_G00084040 [Albula goreensis]